jgi:hypothetical protein
MNDNINVKEDDATEDSHTLFDTNLQGAWSSRSEAKCQLAKSEKEKVRREKRLARTRNSLSKPSLTKSERAKFQMQARKQQRLLAQSNNYIRTGKQTLQRLNEYFSNVMAISLR